MKRKEPPRKSGRGHYRRCQAVYNSINRTFRLSLVVFIVEIGVDATHLFDEAATPKRGSILVDILE